MVVGGDCDAPDALRPGIDAPCHAVVKGTTYAHDRLSTCSRFCLKLFKLLGGTQRTECNMSSPAVQEEQLLELLLNLKVGLLTLSMCPCPEFT